MIIVIGSVTIKQDMMEEALRISRVHVQRSRKETGCIRHNVSIDGEDVNRLVFVEYWESMQTLKTHFAVPESGAFVVGLSGLAASKPEMQIFEAEEQ